MCRYVSRPPIASHRLSLTPLGKICYELKTPYRDGTTHVVFESLDFISKLAALVPSPRINLTRFYGVFAPNSHYRSSIIIKNSQTHYAENTITVKTEKRKPLDWVARLKRAFNIDIKLCAVCGVSVKVLACKDNPVAISQILAKMYSRRYN